MLVNRQKGFTLIELLIVAAILAILLGIAIPNLLKARISSNEANARKALQTLRDAEYQYFEQDLNGVNGRDFTNRIGSLGTSNSLRDPNGSNSEIDSLIDNSFEGAVVDDGNTATEASCGSGAKAGYCVGWSGDVGTDAQSLRGDFGWESTPTSVNRVGRRDFSAFSDKAIKCRLSSQPTGSLGQFESVRTDTDCL